jgi:hypothetical protein
VYVIACVLVCGGCGVVRDSNWCCVMVFVVRMRVI